MERHKTNAVGTKEDVNMPTSISRRAFLAQTAAAIVIAPTALRASLREPSESAILHLATHSLKAGHIHTFAFENGSSRLLGSTPIDSFAAFAAHPVLPVLYVAQNCEQWKGTPRGIVETYTIQRGAHPLQLIAQTPMSLSATGPRSIAVSSCGSHLLVSASRGGAWNGFVLDSNGVPSSVAMARKETGNAQGTSTPHGLAFAPKAPLAVGTDPGSERLTLLAISSEEIKVLDRHQPLSGIALTLPIWTANGAYIVIAGKRKSSLLLYGVKSSPDVRHKAEMQLLGEISTRTPATALLAHPTDPAIFLSRHQQGGSALEHWKIEGNQMKIANATWIPGKISALTCHGSSLWIATEDRLMRLSMRDFRNPASFEMRLPAEGVQAIILHNVQV